MKTVILFSFCFFCISIYSFCQNYSVQSSEEMKISRRSSAPQIIGSDETGLYFTTFRTKRKYMTTDYYDKIYSIVKFDYKYKQLYDYEYESNLKGSEVYDIQLIKGSLYLFSYLHDRKGEKFSVFSSLINKENGKLSGELKEIGNFLLDSKDSYPLLTIYPGPDSSGIILTLSSSFGKKEKINIKTFDLNLNETNNTTIVSQSERELHFVYQVVPVKKDPVLVAETNYEYVQTGKKKKSVYKDFTLTAYKPSGEKLYSLILDTENRYTLSGRGLINNKELIMSGLYSTNRDSKEINGVFINKYDIQQGKLLSSSYQTLSPDILKRVSDKTGGNLKSELETEDAGLSNQFRVKNILINPKTNTPLLIAEFFSVSNYSTSSTFNGKIEYDTYFRFTNAELLLIETNEKYEISRITSLPKKQIERFRLGGFYGSIASSTTGVSTILSGRSLDFYSSFSSFIHKDKLMLIMNDHPANTGVKRQGDNARITDDLSTSSTFVLTYDFSTGLFTRKSLFNNSGQPIPLTKEAMLLGNELFLYATIPHLLGKSDFKIIKITIK